MLPQRNMLLGGTSDSFWGKYEVACGLQRHLAFRSLQLTEAVLNEHRPRNFMRFQEANLHLSAGMQLNSSTAGPPKYGVTDL